MENGKWVVKPELVAECTVWRRDSSKPFTGQVAYSEYCQKTADGKPTKFWAEKPETMLKKVAESQVLRKAFNIHGVFSPEEMGAGFETEGGDIITSAVEVEYSRVDNDKSHLSVVKSTEPEPKPLSKPLPEPTSPVIDDDEGWADPPPSKAEKVTDGVALEIIALLEARDIPHNIDLECGVISANSFAHKELLKSSGFKWNADMKSWLFQFEPDPF